MKKKLISLLLCSAMAASMVIGCGGSEEPAEAPAATEEEAEAPAEEADGELPTITFTHGYYHDESEWAAAAEMRAIYQEFADAHADEFNFVIVADESGAEGIYNTALNDLGAGSFYDIADFGGWDITPVASAAGAILDLKPYLDEDADFKAGVGVCYDQNLTADGAIYSVLYLHKQVQKFHLNGKHGQTLMQQLTHSLQLASHHLVLTLDGQQTFS